MKQNNYHRSESNYDFRTNNISPQEAAQRRILRNKELEEEKIKNVLDRLKQQYRVYERELKENNENEDRMIDLSIACILANSIPYLLKLIENAENERIKSFHEGYKQGLFDAEMKRLTDED
ncbi:hypothetical protein JK635_08140 [Neobacillus sp. YIM B02564]|uniref:Uncharacterized protein n=1 Tax=Neobacillus paridis TaxID=2803862 RepID=A0ABS1TPM7_9BACI|nr:hypothetical protein [Neobacillus paridis]MBL4952181.1 hypothetical protein [Neobacillus paridis]